MPEKCVDHIEDINRLASPAHPIQENIQSSNIKVDKSNPKSMTSPRFRLIILGSIVGLGALITVIVVPTVLLTKSTLPSSTTTTTTTTTDSSGILSSSITTTTTTTDSSGILSSSITTTTTTTTDSSGILSSSITTTTTTTDSSGILSSSITTTTTTTDSSGILSSSITTTTTTTDSVSTLQPSTTTITESKPEMNSTVRTLPNISINATWSENGVTVAGGYGKGSKLNQLDYPFAIYVDENKTIYIADRDNHRIMAWEYNETTGKIVVGVNETRRPSFYELNHPQDIIFDKETDSLIVCDDQHNRVMRWSHRNHINGETIISDIDCYGLTMDNQRLLYVVDCENNIVMQYNMKKINEGKIVAGGNGPGNKHNQLNCPRYAFVDSEGSIYISDSKNHRVMKWIKNAKEGIIVAGVQGEGNNLTQLSFPSGLFVDSLGTVYVTDYLNHRVMRWYKGATQGDVIVGGNDSGKQANQFNGPVNLAFDQHGNLYVSDLLNSRIQRFYIK